MADTKSEQSTFMNKYLSWPVVCLFVFAVIAYAHFQIPSLIGSKEGYLFALASNLSMAITFIAGAVLERSYPNFFGGKLVVFYRFWLASCSIGTIVIFLILRIFPIPLWTVSPDALAVGYSLVFAGGLLIAWLITRGSKNSVF